MERNEKVYLTFSAVDAVCVGNRNNTSHKSKCNVFDCEFPKAPKNGVTISLETKKSDHEYEVSFIWLWYESE